MSTLSPNRILAVDDSPDNLLLIETLLEDLEEYDLNCVENGFEALDAIASHPPDLILLDVMMPEMDGYEVTKRVRSDSALSFIPILLLTAHSQADVAVGLDAGADDFIRKPFKVEELMARIRALLRLKQSIDQQELVLRQRDDFVARLTHDLRTPLIAANRILEFCQRGTYGQSVEAIAPHLNGVIDSNKQLLNMVNTLLEVYRHEGNRKQLTYVKVDLHELVRRVTEHLSPLAAEKGVQLEVLPETTSSTQSFWVQGDPVELNRVVTNIVGNAIKFTNQGTIQTTLSRTAVADRDSRSSKEQVVVKISDSGTGMSEKELATIFDWFRPGAHVNSGSGLGLHLSKRIVELHNGKIKAESTLGEGSTFWVYLPKLPPENATESE